MLFLSCSLSQVIGIKDGRMGTEVCACIELTERQDCSAEDIKVYCKGKVKDLNKKAQRLPPVAKYPKM